jgi:hypothetical protein
VFLSRQQYAAIGQLAADLGTEMREACSRPITQRKLGDREPIESRDHVLKTASSGWSDERLGQGDGAGAQGLGTGIREQATRPLVMDIALVQVGDQDAGVEDDHSGQSSRSRSSSPGS